MERDEALEKLEALRGVCLVELAARHGQRIFHPREGGGKPKINKGWAGLTLERALGLPVNSRREPNGGSWELKQVSLKTTRNGEMTAKETMQITMFDRAHILAHPFEESHVTHKIGRLILVARLWTGQDETHSPIIAVRAADISLAEAFVYEQIRADYETMRAHLKEGGAPASRMGVLIQSRTKGAGHGSVSRAWYGRARLVNLLLGIGK